MASGCLGSGGASALALHSRVQYSFGRPFQVGFPQPSAKQTGGGGGGAGLSDWHGHTPPQGLFATFVLVVYGHHLPHGQGVPLRSCTAVTLILEGLATHHSELVDAAVLSMLHASKPRFLQEPSLSGAFALWNLCIFTSHSSIAGSFSCEAWACLSRRKASCAKRLALSMFWSSTK
eukprot:CAMPEP_0204576190 /NCGR_PEP_ID=MMETSP0661-20131031/41628_1 /ASSEMBLY_ACC=CAM_ASM_000606 /TAXON_ID=109239 /ORGANISM="Alexandrium margalefi, Strain AMGDE01CS-322" /LENGTH=175 /DNA_ID=CAMNT_0051584913 /DNA_START=292 /DNA_END=819 /DNA_ORIENTATION=-